MNLIIKGYVQFIESVHKEFGLPGLQKAPNIYICNISNTNLDESHLSLMLIK